MSAQGQQPADFFHHWLKHVQLKRFGLLGFFFLSIAIHAVLLWQFSYISRHQPRPFSFSKIAIVAGLTDEVEAFPSAEPAQTQSSSRTRAVRKGAPPGIDTATSSRSESSPAAGNAASGGESSVGPGNILTDRGGVGFAGQGSSSGAVGTKEGTPSSGTGDGTAKGKPQPLKGAPSAAERSVIAIPPSIQRTTSPYESEVYAEADFYALFTPDLRMSVNVAGNEVCLDGDILRTHERRILTQRMTDISKCRYENQGSARWRRASNCCIRADWIYPMTSREPGYTS